MCRAQLEKRATATDTRSQPKLSVRLALRGSVRWRGWRWDARAGTPRFRLSPRLFIGSFLKLALEKFDLVGQRNILGDEGFDLTDRMQHRGVIAAAEAPPDFRQ